MLRGPDAARQQKHRELGKHCTTAHLRVLMQVKGYGG